MHETNFEIQWDGKNPEQRQDKARSFNNMDFESKLLYVIALLSRGFNMALYYYLTPFGIIAFTLIYAYRYSYEADLSYLHK